MILHDPKNIRYFSGYCGEGIAVITPERKVLLVDGRYTIEAQQNTGKFEVVTTSTPYEEISKMGFARIGIEENHLTLRQVKKLEGITTFDISEKVANMRAVKTETELKNLSKAAEIANQALHHITACIQPGITTEKQAALELEFWMRRNGAESVSFDIIVASGERSALPHAVPTDAVIPENGYVLLDYGCKYNGYCSDMTRMIPYGEISTQMQEIHDIVAVAQQAALAVVRAGVSAKEVDEAAREVIKQAGYGEKFVHSTGHGVGLDIHEEPRINSKSEAILQENMVITVEPGIYIEGIGGVRIEDMICVTADGYINFSHEK